MLCHKTPFTYYTRKSTKTSQYFSLYFILFSLILVRTVPFTYTVAKNTVASRFFGKLYLFFCFIYPKHNTGLIVRPVLCFIFVISSYKYPFDREGTARAVVEFNHYPVEVTGCVGGIEPRGHLVLQRSYYRLRLYSEAGKGGAGHTDVRNIRRTAG